MHLPAVACRFVACVVLSVAAATAAAQPASPQEQRAQQAQAALSARYAQLWTVLGGESRQRFAADQRRWLNVTRWQAQRDCLRNRSLQDEADAADCLADVTLTQLRSLSEIRLAAH